jgi:2-keto-4-pentenoate hydratase
VQEAGEIEGSADKPEAWALHAGVRVHMSSLVRLAFAKQFTLANRNRRVQAQHSAPSQQARVPDTDACSDMLCRGDVVAVALEVGYWHALSVFAVVGI